MDNAVYRVLSKQGNILAEGTVQIPPLAGCVESMTMRIPAEYFHKNTLLDPKLYEQIKLLIDAFPTNEDLFNILLGNNCKEVIIIQKLYKDTDG